MNIRKYMEAVGIEEEHIKALEDKIKEEGINVILDNRENTGYIPKSRFDEVNNQKNQFKTQVGELSDKLTEYEEDIEKAKEKIEAYDNLKGEYDRLIKEGEIKKALMVHKPVNVDDVLKLLDEKDIKYDDEGKMTNLEELAKGMVDSKPYLFDDSGGGVGSGTNPAGGGDVEENMADLLKDYYGEN